MLSRVFDCTITIPSRESLRGNTTNRTEVNSTNPRLPMPVKNDRRIRKMVRERDMINPFS
jgi:hypothetical protein